MLELFSCYTKFCTATRWIVIRINVRDADGDSGKEHAPIPLLHAVKQTFNYESFPGPASNASSCDREGSQKQSCWTQDTVLELYCIVSRTDDGDDLWTRLGCTGCISQQDRHYPNYAQKLSIAGARTVPTYIKYNWDTALFNSP